jgi:hypothetical protein
MRKLTQCLLVLGHPLGHRLILALQRQAPFHADNFLPVLLTTI